MRRPQPRRGGRRPRGRGRRPDRRAGADAWQRAELEGLLAELGEETEAAKPDDLALAELGALLAERLRGRPTRANFRPGP